MTVKVLIVDDSRFFRRRVTEMLEIDPRIEVIGTAADGEEAIRQVNKLKPDVITMDIEMPVLDGITAVRRIMAIRPTPILMFSTLTTEGAQSTLDALEAGALDFLPKRFEDISSDRDVAKRTLVERVYMLGQKGLAGFKPVVSAKTSTSATQAKASSTSSPRPAATQPVVGKDGKARKSQKIVVIGTSTGGPAALQEVLSHLPKDYPVPVLLVQHMPGTFTNAFAQRLDQCSDIAVKEAADGEVLRPGQAYLAPGGKQMELEQKGGSVIIRIKGSPPEQNYKPCVDITFNSVAQVYPGQALAVIMTGMGADGREGCRKLKETGCSIWIQDEKSSIIFGMPHAVQEAGLADRIYSLTDIGPHLVHDLVH